MDKYLIGTIADVQHDLYFINEVAAMWWATQGYTVIETPEGKAVIGKNALTGADNNSALTTSWAIPERLDDEKWFIPSPSSDERFKNWRQYLPEGVEIKCDEILYDSIIALNQPKE